MENKKPLTQAQAIFGKDFGNRPIITKRPEGMPRAQYKSIMPRAQYKSIMRQQKQVIKNCLR